MRTRFLIGLLFALYCFPVPALAGREPYRIFVPPTPTSIPVILAADQMEDLEVTIFVNHTQAHTLFLRGDIPLLTTGLSIGTSFFNSGVPIQVINTYVSGMTSLVNRGEKIKNFKQLTGKTILLPFAGSPIEEVTEFFMAREGLNPKKDFNIVYAPFETALELLKKGKAQAAVLPQPFVSMLTAETGIVRSIEYKSRWDQLTDSRNGYPQIGIFVKTDWAKEHKYFITRLNKEIAKALQVLSTNPDRAANRAGSVLGYSEDILSVSLADTHFSLKIAEDLKRQIKLYFLTLGKPLDERYQSFFYLDP